MQPQPDGRRQLPTRRPQVSIDLVFGGNLYTLSIGGDGTSAELLEVFVSTWSKAGTALTDAVRDAAITISLAIQHGCSVDTLSRALTRDHDGKPASIIGAVVEAMVDVQAEQQKGPSL